MNVLLAIVAYLMYLVFCARFFSHSFIWLRAAGQSAYYPSRTSERTPGLWAVAALDILLLRRLFASDKPAWLGSWFFHVTFFVVILRHLRYFLEPVPGCIEMVQPYGIFAGYLLSLALVLLLAVRVFSGRKRYISYSNYIVLSTVLCISLSGLLMRNFFRPDLADAKAFIIGIMTFHPGPAPEGLLFAFHFCLAFLLLPFVPMHIFTAPFVSMEARRREEELGGLVHEK